jgi:hypothetical protein
VSGIFSLFLHAVVRQGISYGCGTSGLGPLCHAGTRLRSLESLTRLPAWDERAGEAGSAPQPPNGE